MYLTGTRMVSYFSQATQKQVHNSARTSHGNMWAQPATLPSGKLT